VSYPEADLAREQLLIAVVNDGTSRVLVKGALPLSGLIPGYHYNLAVALSDACVLYVTVLLELGAKQQLDFLQGTGIVAAAVTANTQMLQLSLTRLETARVKLDNG